MYYRRRIELREPPPILIAPTRLHNPQLCDNSFEGHVPPYSSEKTGPPLHALNERSKDFKTQSTAVVDEFARESGFIITASYGVPFIAKVTAFTEGN